MQQTEKITPADKAFVLSMVQDYLDQDICDFEIHIGNRWSISFSANSAEAKRPAAENKPEENLPHDPDEEQPEEARPEDVPDKDREVLASVVDCFPSRFFHR